MTGKGKGDVSGEKAVKNGLSPLWAGRRSWTQRHRLPQERTKFIGWQAREKGGCFRENRPVFHRLPLDQRLPPFLSRLVWLNVFFSLSSFVPVVHLEFPSKCLYLWGYSAVSELRLDVLSAHVIATNIKREIKFTWIFIRLDATPSRL
jgi:hypothetical protein